MDRDKHKKYVPYCPPNIPVVDQYMWSGKDKKMAHANCLNGLSQDIYNCRGELSRTLPLEMYPKVNEIHPQVKYILESGDAFPYLRRYRRNNQQVEGYQRNSNQPTIFLQSNTIDPNKLPSPEYSCRRY